MVWFGYAIAFVLGALVAYVSLKGKMKNVGISVETKSRNIDILNQWIILQHENMPLSDTLEKKGIYKVAIYGMGILGRHLIRELHGKDIQIVYALDRRNLKQFRGVEVYKLGNNLPEVDAVINTVFAESNEIAANIHKYMSCNILNLEDLVFDSYVTKEEDNSERF